MDQRPIHLPLTVSDLRGGHTTCDQMAEADEMGVLAPYGGWPTSSRLGRAVDCADCLRAVAAEPTP